VIDIEKSPFDFHDFTSGGMVPEYTNVNKNLAEKIAEKHREPNASVMTYIRTKLRSTLLTFNRAQVYLFYPCCSVRLSRQ